MVRPLDLPVFLLSVHSPAHLHPTHMTGLPMYLPQASTGNRSYQRGSEGHAPLLVSLVSREPI